MANLTKISNVNLTINFESVESFNLRKALVDNNIPHTITFVFKKEDHQGIYDYYGSMVYGQTYLEKTFSSLPILVWDESYDDYERWKEVVTTLNDLNSSNLINFKNLVQSG
jgi:hypothetical protein